MKKRKYRNTKKKKRVVRKKDRGVVDSKHQSQRNQDIHVINYHCESPLYLCCNLSTIILL